MFGVCRLAVVSPGHFRHCGRQPAIRYDGHGLPRNPRAAIGMVDAVALARLYQPGGAIAADPGAARTGASKPPCLAPSSYTVRKVVRQHISEIDSDQ